MPRIRGELEGQGEGKKMQDSEKSNSLDTTHLPSLHQGGMGPSGQPLFGTLEDIRLHADYRHGLRQYSFSYRVRIPHPIAAPTLLAIGRLLWPSMPSSYHAKESLQSQEQQLSFILALIQDRLEESGNYCSDPPRVNPQGDTTFAVCQPCLRLRSGYRITAAIWRILALAATDTREQRNEALCDLLKPVMAKEKKTGLKGFNIIHFLKSADAIGLPWLPLVGEVYQVGHGRFSRLLKSSLTDATPAISSAIAYSKLDTAALLRKSGLPGALHIAVNTVEQAIDQAQKIGFPVVLKPYNCEGGHGVFCGLFTADQVREAYGKASLVSKGLIVERQIIGKDYRIQVANGEIHGVVLRTPGGVTADGVNTIADLVDLENRSRAEAEDDRRFLHPIKIDSETKNLLESQGLGWRSVPEAGRFVRLRWACNVTAGGVPSLVPPEEIHPDNQMLAKAVCRQLRLDVAGVDFLIEDISLSWKSTMACICEVNSQPQMHTSMHPLLLQQMFGIKRGRVPTVLLLSARENGDTLSHLLTGMQAMGMRPGMLKASCQTLNPEKISRRWSSARAAIESLLIDRNMDALLVSCDLRQGLQQGWPIARADVVVVDTNGCSGDELELLRQQTALSFDLCPARIEIGGDNGQALLVGLSPASGIAVTKTRNRHWDQVVQVLLQRSGSHAYDSSPLDSGSWEHVASEWASHIDQASDEIGDKFGLPCFTDFVGDVRHCSLLDAGCGNGRSALLFARRGANVVGIDLSPSLIEIARENPVGQQHGVEFRILSSDNLEGIQDNSFDHVTSVMALMNTSDLLGSLSEFSRVLKPGGLLSIMVLHPCFFTKRLSISRQHKGRDKMAMVSDYFEKQPYEQMLSLSKGSKSSVLVRRFPRTLADYLQGLLACGLMITKVEEPRPSQEILQELPNLHFWNQHAAFYLFMQAGKS